MTEPNEQFSDFLIAFLQFLAEQQQLMPCCRSERAELEVENAVHACRLDNSRRFDGAAATMAIGYFIAKAIEIYRDMGLRETSEKLGSLYMHAISSPRQYAAED